MSFNEIDHTLATVGAPKEGGCCWACFDTSKAAPANATTPMSGVEGFVSVGELSNNGYTESKSVNTTDLTGWHGSTIITTVDSESHKFKAEFTEVMRPAVAMLRYGADNVELDGDGNLVHVSGKPAGAIVCALVFDEVMSNGWLRRTVVPRATVTSFDDVTHQKGALMLYGMEFTAAEVDGSSLEVYYAKPAGTTPDATLSALTIGSLSLTPAFDAATTAYAATTTNATNTITATATDPAATVEIRVGDATVESGSAATWADGENTVTVTVTNGTAAKAYVVTVTKSDGE